MLKGKDPIYVKERLNLGCIEIPICCFPSRTRPSYVTDWQPRSDGQRWQTKQHLKKKLCKMLASCSSSSFRLSSSNQTVVFASVSIVGMRAID